MFRMRSELLIEIIKTAIYKLTKLVSFEKNAIIVCGKKSTNLGQPELKKNSIGKFLGGYHLHYWCCPSVCSCVRDNF